MLARSFKKLRIRHRGLIQSNQGIKYIQRRTTKAQSQLTSNLANVTGTTL